MYDPKVTSEQIYRDMSTPKFEWDRPNYSHSHTRLLDNVQVRACLGPLRSEGMAPQCAHNGVSL